MKALVLVMLLGACAQQTAPTATVNRPTFSGEIRGDQYNWGWANLQYDGTMVIDSTGGDLYAGIEIGRAISERRVTVIVDNWCASACAILAAASPKVIMRPGAQIAVHSPYPWDAGSQADLERYFEEVGAPYSITGYMLKTPNESSHIATDIELRYYFNVQ